MILHQFRSEETVTFVLISLSKYEVITNMKTFLQKFQHKLNLRGTFYLYYTAII